MIKGIGIDSIELDRIERIYKEKYNAAKTEEERKQVQEEEKQVRLDAMKREFEIKSFPRYKKILLIKNKF